MARDHALMIVLSAIILLNIIAILLLQNRLAEKEQPRPVVALPENRPAPLVIKQERELVRAVIIPGCSDCFNISQYLALLNETMDMEVETASADAAAAFDTSRLPALAFNASIEAYPGLITGWDQIGTVIEITDGDYAGKWYVLPTMHAPFVENGTVHGRVSVTYLTMKSCGECYSSTVLREELSQYGITPYKEQTVDAETPAGRALIANYNITAVPTLVMDRGADFYPLQPGWSVVGTIEDDGSYVLRDLQRMQVTYYDLASKRLMKP